MMYVSMRVLGCYYYPITLISYSVYMSLVPACMCVRVYTLLIHTYTLCTDYHACHLQHKGHRWPIVIRSPRDLPLNKRLSPVPFLPFTIANLLAGNPLVCPVNISHIFIQVQPGETTAVIGLGFPTILLTKTPYYYSP